MAKIVDYLTEKLKSRDREKFIVRLLAENTIRSRGLYIEEEYSLEERQQKMLGLVEIQNVFAGLLTGRYPYEVDGELDADATAAYIIDLSKELGVGGELSYSMYLVRAYIDRDVPGPRVVYPKKGDCSS
jgi:hypothetical protein